MVRPRHRPAIGRVGNDQLRVDLEPGAETGTHSGQAPNGELNENDRGSRLLEGQVVVQAGEVLGEDPLAMRIVLGEVDEVEHDQPAAQPQRGLDQVGQAPLR